MPPSDPQVPDYDDLQYIKRPDYPVNPSAPSAGPIAAPAPPPRPIPIVEAPVTAVAVSVPVAALASYNYEDTDIAIAEVYLGEAEEFKSDYS